MGQAEHQRRVDHGDLEYGLATMVRKEYYGEFDEVDLLPEMGGRTVSAVVVVLLSGRVSSSLLVKIRGLHSVLVRRHSFKRDDSAEESCTQ